MLIYFSFSRWHASEESDTSNKDDNHEHCTTAERKRLTGWWNKVFDWFTDSPIHELVRSHKHLIPFQTFFSLYGWTFWENPPLSEILRLDNFVYGNSGDTQSSGVTFQCKSLLTGWSGILYDWSEIYSLLYSSVRQLEIRSIKQCRIETLHDNWIAVCEPQMRGEILITL